jgi:diaminopimelate epimerase
MQALGNDFVVVDAERLLASDNTRALLSRWQEAAPSLARHLSDRRFGVGADGLILAINLQEKRLSELASQIYGANLGDCQLAWTYTNGDGSNAEMCGNGLRCLALWAHDRGLLAHQCKVLTQVGPVEIFFRSTDEIKVDLGPPNLAPKKIPFTGLPGGERVVSSPFDISSTNGLSITCVNMGNPHCLVFSGGFLNNIHIKDIQLPFETEKQLRELPGALTSIAEEIQGDPRFPQGANVSFVIAHTRNSAQAVVFERGCGPTLACGSAAAAILVGGVLEGRLDRTAQITLPGGSLLVEWSEPDNHVRITGPARFVFDGQVSLPRSFFDLGSGAQLSGAMAK